MREQTEGADLVSAWVDWHGVDDGGTTPSPVFARGSVNVLGTQCVACTGSRKVLGIQCVASGWFGSSTRKKAPVTGCQRRLWKALTGVRRGPILRANHRCLMA